MTLSAKIGHRGAFLIVCSVSGLLYGIALMTAQHATWWPALQGEVMNIPLHWWGIFWIVGSLFEFTGAFVVRDRWQWACSSFISGVWAVGAVVETGNLLGPPIIYAGICAAILVGAGWPDPIYALDHKGEESGHDVAA